MSRVTPIMAGKLDALCAEIDNRSAVGGVTEQTKESTILLGEAAANVMRRHGGGNTGNSNAPSNVTPITGPKHGRRR